MMKKIFNIFSQHDTQGFQGLWSDAMRKKTADKSIKTSVSGHGVRFELESDAEKLFKSAVDAMSHRSAPLIAKDEDRSAHNFAKSRKNKASPVKIDLHGMTLEAAKRYVDNRINDILVHLAPGASAAVDIVTGKGLNSGSGGGVLAREIPEWVRQRFARHIVEMDESPAEVQLGGIPLRGNFRVTIKG